MVFSRGALVPKKSCPEPLVHTTIQVLAPDVASFMKQQGLSVVERTFLNITLYDSLQPVHQTRTCPHSNLPLEFMPTVPHRSSDAIGTHGFFCLSLMELYV